MVSQQQRSDTTRATLLEAFRSSFLKNGYDRTTTQTILSETGLSKGALYHHFRSKAEIIKAIYESESRSAIDRALVSVDVSAPPLKRLRDACIAWLGEVRAPGIAKILFDIGPSALGQTRAREIEDGYSLGLLEALFQQAIDVGDIKETDIRLAAALVNALVAEAALYMLRTGRPSEDMLSKLLDGYFRALRP